ncbi:MAG: hypothetical protein AB9873_06875 [Syntrophobacteraceae bacterium]
MCAVYSPKTLARTLTYILCHSPGEYGLFWDPDGSMPWKEVYWVLQEDPSLRFVRETHFKEIAYLGIELPVYLDGRVCRLKAGAARPEYAVAENVPRRLFFGCPRRRFSQVQEDGLLPTSRTLLPLLADREMALRMGRRRDPDAFVVEVRTELAAREGTSFLAAGGPLYLVQSVSHECLLLPVIREEDSSRKAEKKRNKPAKKASGHGATTPGSFLMTEAHFQGSSAGSPGRDAAGKSLKHGKRGPGWKRDSRKERSKRDV